MFQLIYHSRYTISASGLNTIRDILLASEANNYRKGITGFLIFDKSSFIQVLEGERSAVEDTYLRICDDPRHSQPTVIETRDIRDRAFPEWAMGGFIGSPEAKDIYARHGLTGGLEASNLTADQVICLAQDLAASEQLRQAKRTLGR